MATEPHETQRVEPPEGRGPLPEPSPPAGAPLSEADRRILSGLAREAVEAYLSGRPPPEPPKGRAALDRPCAVFVTLRDGRGELRGCKGEIEARRPLAEAVMYAAVSAATADPRFPPVTATELPDLHIEISALSTLRPIAPHAVELGRHGLVLRSGPFVGLLLPQVPVHLGWDRDAFLDGICLKAGLPHGSWERPGSELLAFEAEVWAGDGGLPVIRSADRDGPGSVPGGPATDAPA